MCETCNDLQARINAATAAGDHERARVIQVILDGHRANTCPHRWAAVLWRDGKTWEVGRKSV